jgi:glutaredoxin
MSGPDGLRVYWQPGCTSCLRTKEFLASRGVPFTPINVLDDPDAMAQLQALGARSVPVVARGDQFVYGQELADVARFVGVALDHKRLEPKVLVARLDRLLAIAGELVALIPPGRLADTIPTRPRSYADIAYHVGMIVQGFLDAADPERESELTYAHFERRPPPGESDPQSLARWIGACREALRDWWRVHAQLPPTRELRTYYGERPQHEVLERTAWHVAQHCRQLDHIVVEVLKLGPATRLRPADLAGLPVPEQVWDPEIRFA